jgi:hypothetical protein
MRYRMVAAVVFAATLLCASPAHAYVKYSDWRAATPAVFARYGDEWHEVASGGYANSGTNFSSYPAHGWSYCTRLGDEYGVWKFPGGATLAYGEWQAYITTSGTNTSATYFDGYSDPVVNQLAVHGWTTVQVHNWCAGQCRLSDAEGAAFYVAGHKTDWDAVRLYY